MNNKSFKKAFDIGDIPDNIDLNAPPLTGMDYLHRVRLESLKYPKVVVSNLDTTRFLNRQTFQVDDYNGFIQARPGFEPNPEWQSDVLFSFLDKKMKMYENRELLKGKFEKREFPKISNALDWCNFSLGTSCANRIYSPEESDKEMTEENSTGIPPYLSVILYLNQPKVVKLLSYHTNWLERIGFSHAQGTWIYALLICLEKPLDPDTCDLLRSLSRKCSKLRDGLTSSEDEFLKPLNLILTIISMCFDQKDMSDGFASNK